MATVEPTTVEAGGNGAPAADQIVVRNPATGELVRTVAVTSLGELAAMAERARQAQPAWEALGFEARARIFRRAQKWMFDNQERVIETVSSETGKTWEDALVAEINYIAGALGFWAKKAPEYLADEKIRSSNPFVMGRKLVVRYRPLGVVGVIGPWNYPLNNSFGDCIPALAAGNSVILKPSEITPLSSELMRECMLECGLAEGVFQVAQGRGDVGAELIDHVDMIMFTGSTETGKKIMERAARTLTPVSLELGGKDPMIVLADADIERAANAAVHYSFQNSGQTCISVERVYVEAPIYDEFVGKVVEKAKAVRQGDPTGGWGSVDVGAMTFPKQLDIIQRHVDEAQRDGAKVLVGGHARTDRGQYFEPTVLVDVTHDMSAIKEETFGPTLPIMKVESTEEAVRLANDSPFGLAASVWTKDAAKGEEIAREIEAGTVSVNDAQIHYVALELPMGGWKASGMGQRHGAGGIRKFCRQQSILVTRFAPTKKDLHFLPYTPKSSKLVQRALKILYGRGKRD